MKTCKMYPSTHSTRKYSLTTLSSSIMLAMSTNMSAAPGTLADGPLFLSSKVQPNIFFMIDDSGSMDWEVLLSEGARAAHSGATNGYNMDFTPNNSEEIRELCYGYNVLAYNPNRTYTPWQGLDSSNNPYPDMSFTAARSNPYYTSTTNLNNPGSSSNDDHFYITWNDDGDGVYQAGECPVPTNYGSRLDSSECASSPGCVRVSTLSAAQQRNYANWWSYYRKREYVMKRALSSVIQSSTSRAGLATINAQNDNSLTGNNNDIFSPVRDIDDKSTPVNSTAVTNKRLLLRSLFRINSTHGTPLRRGLEDVGEYFEGNNPNSWGSSPILPAAQGGECQQNFTILMSDGYWNGGNPSVGDADSNDNTSYDGGVYADGDTSNTISNTLADVAMHYYERDLSPLTDLVPVSPVDQNPAQHLVTYTVAFGINGTLNANPLDTDTTFNWPTPTSNNNTTIDDMRHAAWNGRGQFLNAGNPQQLVTSLQNAISDIQDRTGTAAAVSFNSTSLQTNTKLISASFNSERWSGDLFAYNLDIANNALGTVAWRASTDLNSRTTASRNIVTYNGTTGTEFVWANLTAAQKNDLRTNASGTLENEANGMARLDYIRGHRGCEIGDSGTCSYTDSSSNTFNSKIFRTRNSRLGDIVHSSPTYVGPPNTRYPNNIESTAYSTFVNANSSRAGMTYVGANDGMLHAFNDSGVEVFSYIPNLLYSTSSGAGLHNLTDSGYVHRYYVDLTANVTDAFVDLNSSGTKQWKSILVGGLRGGGKGLFAIDVTDPGAFSTASGAAGKVLWEFTNNNLGYTFSDIRIGKMNNGEWAAIFGNGYNNDPLGDGKSKIFIVYLDGSNLASPITLETGAGTIANGDCDDTGSDCNGMSTPAIVDLNGDGTIDRIYAGDLHGKMWAFDVSSSTTSNWGSVYGTGPSYTPLFTACSGATCTTANRQPITTKPSVARHPFKRDLATQPNLMVFFGTGQYLTSTDNTSTATQTFYGVWDAGTGNLNRGSLVAQTLTDTATNGTAVRTVSDNAVDYATKKGWRIDLPTSKERSVTNSTAFGQLVFFNTMIPSSSACSAGGDGWLMAVDMINGGEPSFQPIDINGDGYFNTNDMVASTHTVGTKMSGIPTESRFISDKRVTANSDGSVTIENIQPSSPLAPSRMSWTGLER